MAGESGQEPDRTDKRYIEVEGLRLRSERTGDRAVVTVSGELSFANARALDQELYRAEATDVSEIVLDLRALDFIDSTGIRTLYEASIRSRDRLRMYRPPAPVQRTLDSHGLGEVFPFVE